MNVDRSTLVSTAKSVVVKLGSQGLSDARNHLDLAFVASIAGQVAALRHRGVRVTLVSSGAVSSGLAELGLDTRPADLATLQAVAAVGQRRLMDGWAGAFAPHGLKVAQLLLTRDDTDHRTRFLNLRNTIHAVHELGAVPIINENDTVSTDELVRITFGDNDLLAATVAQALRADLLILLSVVDGVLDTNKQRLPMFTSIDEAAKHLQVGKSALGKGGMNSKLEAARLVTGSGETMVIAHGRTPDVLTRILAGEDVGTLFVPSSASRRTGRSRWIRAARGKGSITVDAGAAVAITQKNKSLLPAGITAVTGDFDRGDVVDLLSPNGQLIARGLSNYTAGDVGKILGKKTSELRALVGSHAYDEVIHRDNLVCVEHAKASDSAV
ncbi:MAG: glutamate 5-kinase [Tepidisphaeraceae bacterium]